MQQWSSDKEEPRMMNDDRKDGFTIWKWNWLGAGRIGGTPNQLELGACKWHGIRVQCVNAYVRPLPGSIGIYERSFLNCFACFPAFEFWTGQAWGMNGKIKLAVNKTSGIYRSGFQSLLVTTPHQFGCRAPPHFA
jgi:hypothetical protein